MPWTMDGKRVPGGFTTGFPAGAHVFEVDVKVPVRTAAAAFICEGTRPVVLELDGQEILAHDADMFVPAVHRSGHRAVLELTGGLHRIRIRLADGGEGCFCFGIADPYSWFWNPDLKYLPVSDGQ